MTDRKAPISYAQSGVSYEKMDPLKRFAQKKASETAKNLSVSGMREVSASRGESAYVWDEGDCYKALVIEDLGTKNLVADEMRAVTGKSYYDSLAQDTVAMVVNDLVVVGAKPLVVGAYFALGDSNWTMDKKRTEDLVEGWARACDMAGATWGGGETATVKGIVDDKTVDLAGCAVGVIKPKARLTLGDKISAGDSILLVPSSGIHANGLTLARKIAGDLPGRYATKISDGTMYGEALLVPTHIYASLIESLFEAGVDIHYMVNITGHGFRKLMRATLEFSYVIKSLPKPQPVFSFIQEHSGNSDEEMYANYNMGAGFAIILPRKDVTLALKVGKKRGFSMLLAGEVQKGAKKVVLEPKGIVFNKESLGVR